MKNLKTGWSQLILLLPVVAALAGCGAPGAERATPQPTAPASPGHAEHGAPAPGSYRLDWSFEPAAVQAGQPVRISYTVKDAAGRAVTEFDEVHEKLTHLVIVSSDLAYFDHVHPALKDGVFGVSATLPTAGGYKLYADVTPQGGQQQLVTRELQATGGAARPAYELRADERLTKTFGDLSVTLRPDPQPIPVGRETTLVFTLKNAKTGQPVTDLNPYLGAFGHAVIVSQDAQKFLHTHPAEMEKAGMKMGGEAHGQHQPGTVRNTGGPDVSFETTFPAPGLYKVWGQFNYQGKIVTADFVVRAQ